MKFRLHGFEPRSRANGPGVRSVMWLQGCTLGCPGCFNPDTHSPDSGEQADTDELAARILADSEIDGVSFSGGEPFQQPEALLDLLENLEGSGLSRLVFSGYSLTEISQQLLGPKIIEHLDVLIAGRYAQSRHVGKGLLGSSNQAIHLLTSRHSHADFDELPSVEVHLRPDGSVTLTGIQSLSLRGLGKDGLDV